MAGVLRSGGAGRASAVRAGTVSLHPHTVFIVHFPIAKRPVVRAPSLNRVDRTSVIAIVIVTAILIQFFRLLLSVVEATGSVGGGLGDACRAEVRMLSLVLRGKGATAAAAVVEQDGLLEHLVGVERIHVEIDLEVRCLNRDAR